MEISVDSLSISIGSITETTTPRVIIVAGVTEGSSTADATSSISVPNTKRQAWRATRVSARRYLRNNAIEARVITTSVTNTAIRGIAK